MDLDRIKATARLARYTTPEVVARALADLGDEMFDACQRSEDGDDSWAAPYGGLTGALLVIAEIHAYAAHAIERAAALRSAVAEDLLEDHTLVELAAELDVSPQALHKARKRPGLLTDFAHALTFGGQL